MKLDQLVTVDRVGVVRGHALDKDESLRQLAALLANGLAGADPDVVFAILRQREELQSTGIGDGVAVPHGTLESASGQIGALLLCPDGVSFDSIDDQPARILFGVVGPKQAVEHLKVLARISRLLRSGDFRDRLLGATTADEAYALLHDEDKAIG